ncbi:hypothetical protein OG422_10675 [Streptomyces sp. NBC_01525]|uniref:hypothetical protein n=1 Tax=Streptomyces sp. NBC_01525 TaxID=2903893 RepID=UPI00386D7770
MNHRYVSGAAVLASAAALVATVSGAAVAAPHAAPASPASVRATVWKPCHPPTGYRHFLKLNSAKNTGGKTVVRVTPETCKYNAANDEEVVYTPTGPARSFGFVRGATVTVFKGNTAVKVTPEWLTKHKLTNTPHFAYRLNGQGKVTAMQEIYHP